MQNPAAEFVELLIVLGILFLLSNTWVGSVVISLFYYPTIFVVWLYSLLPWWGWLVGIFLICCLTPDSALSVQFCVQVGIVIIVVYCGWSIVSTMIPMVVGSWINTFYPTM